MCGSVALLKYHLIVVVHVQVRFKVIVKDMDVRNTVHRYWNNHQLILAMLNALYIIRGR